MKVGLLGGSFNPPHPGHIHISNIALKKLGLNQIWWIPTAHNPLKDPKIYDSYSNRIAKCNLITKNNPKIYIKEFDQIYTAKLIKSLKRQFKNVNFFWIMGADNLSSLDQWQDFKIMFRKVNLVIVSRETFLKKIKKTKSWKWIKLAKPKIINSKKLNISSTQIRKNS